MAKTKRHYLPDEKICFLQKSDHEEHTEICLRCNLASSVLSYWKEKSQTRSKDRLKKNYQRIDPKVQKLKSAIDRYKRYADNNSGNDPVQTLLEKHQKPGDSTPDIYIPIKSGIQKTKPERIIICATGGKGITIHLMGNESITISKTLNWLEERLESYGFFRVHNSYLVNLEHVKKIIHVREGAEITLSNGKLAEVSKRKKAQFLDVLSRQNRLNIL